MHLPDHDMERIELKQWLAEYFETARTLMTLEELASEFASLGGRAPGWPRATYPHWRREIVASIERGELTIGSDGYVRPSVKPDESMKQGSLFE